MSRLNKELTEAQHHPAVKDLINVFKALVDKRIEIIEKLRNLRKKVEKKEMKKEFGELIGTVGAVAIGVPESTACSAVEVVNKAHSYWTGDPENKILMIVREDKEEMDTCRQTLNGFRNHADELTQNYGFDKKVPASLLCQSLFRSKPSPVCTEGNLTIAGKYFTDLLETTWDCQTTLRTCELSMAGGEEYGYGLCRDMAYMTAGNLLIEGVVLMTEAFLLDLSEAIRKPHSPSNTYVYGIVCLLISLVCLYLLKYSK